MCPNTKGLNACRCQGWQLEWDLGGQMCLCKRPGVTFQDRSHWNQFISYWTAKPVGDLRGGTALTRSLG